MELWGVLAAVLSSALGGTSIGATRYLAGAIDPLTLGAIRFGLGFAFLLPVALWRKERWPRPSDWLDVACLGALFFGLFPILFNASLAFTTAARGALALSTLPLLTMVAGAGLGVEPLTGRKTLGVLIATAGVAIALLAGLAAAPAGAWRGDLLMVGAAACMALYNVWSRPFIARSGPIPFATAGMGVGAFGLTLIAAFRGGFAPVAAASAGQELAMAYLGIVGGALTFFLWAFALGRTTPTRVAISVTVNPIAAALVGMVLLDEPLRWSLVVGLVAVFAGIWVAARGAGSMARR
ncbi:DMT family transporter [Methylocapsa sp. S129]|uniref:DMT family transporter n=1 Tax=Methylocapsa sp. S129 TaxID=1641869 RepID=UPI00131D72C2|nr:DMT family transporter [Methylocapsa sp. S129]